MVLIILAIIKKWKTVSVYCKLIQQIRATKREFCTIKVNNNNNNSNNNNNNNNNYRTFIMRKFHKMFKCA